MDILQMLAVCHLFFMHTGYSNMHKESPSAVLKWYRDHVDIEGCILFSPLSFGRHFSLLP